LDFSCSSFECGLLKKQYLYIYVWVCMCINAHIYTQRKLIFSIKYV